MKISTSSPVTFGTKVSLQYFVSLLQNAKPYGHNFNENAVTLGSDQVTLIVTPAQAVAMGGGVTRYEFAPDGSVTKQSIPALLPTLTPTTQQVLPKGSISKNVLDAVRKQVVAKTPKP